MKKFFLPTLLLMLVVALTACGGAVKNTDENKSVANPSAVQNQVANEPASPEKAEGIQANTGVKPSGTKTPDVKPADKSTVSENKGVSSEKQAGAKNNISVITKSDNAVSSAEKEKVLKDLDNEVNGMLKDIDKLDEVSDADLAE